jgi:hypothetical protein
MSQSIADVVEKIRFLRLSLVPPYCENLDEDERSVDDYTAHYALRLHECKEAARKYLSALERVKSDVGDASTATYMLEARARFAASFPFCTDELVIANADDLEGYVEHLMQAYRRDATTGFLARAVEQYIALLNEV